MSKARPPGAAIAMLMQAGRHDYQRARAVSRASKRAGLGVSVVLEKTARVSSSACLTVRSSAHCFFIFLLCSTLLLSFLLVFRSSLFKSMLRPYTCFYNAACATRRPGSVAVHQQQ